jgi:hypothetical protein
MKQLQIDSIFPDTWNLLKEPLVASNPSMLELSCASTERSNRVISITPNEFVLVNHESFQTHWTPCVRFIRANTNFSTEPISTDPSLTLTDDLTYYILVDQNPSNHEDDKCLFIKNFSS